MYRLNLGPDGRILSVTDEKYGKKTQPTVKSFPSGDVRDYRYVNGEFIYEPPEEDTLEDETPSEGNTPLEDVSDTSIEAELRLLREQVAVLTEQMAAVTTKLARVLSVRERADAAHDETTKEADNDRI